MKEMLKKENRTTLIVSIICFVLIGIVATYTYSFFAVTKNNSAIIAGEAESLGLTVVVDQLAPDPSADLIPQMDDYITNAITGRQGSCIDDNGNTVCHTYKITVTNANVKTKVNGTLILDKKNNSNLKWAMYKNATGEETVPSLVSNIKTPEDTEIIKNEEFTAGETKEYYIVVWISETGMIQTDKGDYSGVIDFATSNGIVTVALDDSGANIPELADAMIPVMYDEASSSWVKADTTSSTSQYSWYDYDEKKWANAVFVKSNGIYQTKNQSNVSLNISNAYGTTFTSPEYCSWDSEEGSYMEPRIIEFKFTTGNTNGELSFDIYGEAEDTPAGFDVYLNNETIYNKEGSEWENDGGDYYTISESQFTVSLNSNTEYVLTIRFDCDYEFYNYVRISNFSLPNNLAIPLSISSSGINRWSSNADTGIPLYSSYTIKNEGTFSLNIDDRVYAKGNAAIGKYVCVDQESTECSEIYKITGISQETNYITEADTYISSNMSREEISNSEPGTVIENNNVLAYYVWIPRYKYKVWNKDKVIGIDAYNAQNTGIDIVFESGIATTGDVTCAYDFSKTATSTVRNEDCTGTNGESYYTHPAFTFGNEELTGIWIAKYQISKDITIVPDEEIVGDYLGDGDYYASINNMQSNNNIYGLSTDLTLEDSHRMTNMEWGVLVYLTHSNYGMCTNGVCNQMNNGYRDSEGEWAIISGSGGSTTNNKYGVYDINVDNGELIMLDVSKTNGSYTYSGNISEFNYSDETSKYLTTYAYGTTYADQTAFNRTRLGDALGEVVSKMPDPFGENEAWGNIVEVNDDIMNDNGWYRSYINVGHSKRGSMGYIFDAANYMHIPVGNDATRTALAVFP